MISRPTLIAALVVVELAIVGVAANALGLGQLMSAPLSMAPPNLENLAGSGGAAARPLDRTFVTGPSPRVVVDVRDVDVTVEAGAAPNVRVDETLAVRGFVSGKIPPLVVEQMPDGIHVSAPDSGSVHVMIGSVTHSLRIIVPPAARVEVSSAGTIDVSGLRAKLIAHTSDGSLRVHDHQGDLDVSTNDGRLELVDVHGDAIDAIDHDGRIYLTRVGADRLVAHSDYGRIVADGIRAVDGGLTTRDGRVLVSFASDSNATADVSASDEIKVSGFSSVDGGANRRIVTLGAGRGHFEVSTGDGFITITQGANG
jgi:hypothetical protein